MAKRKKAAEPQLTEEQITNEASVAHQEQVDQPLAEGQKVEASKHRTWPPSSTQRNSKPGGPCPPTSPISSQIRCGNQPISLRDRNGSPASCPIRILSNRSAWLPNGMER